MNDEIEVKTMDINMSEEQLEAVRDFIHFVTETGEFSGQDNDFLKAMYYEFKNHQHNRG